MTPVVSTVSPSELLDWLRLRAKRVVFLGGYSGRGYDDADALLARVRRELSAYSPEATLVASGATAEGVGAAYAVAHDMGFETIGIVSSLARQGLGRFSPHVDRVFLIDDESWGGFREGTEQLSPVSQAIVSSTDTYVAFGGGAITRAEAMSAGRAGKDLRIHFLKDAAGELPAFTVTDL